MNVIEKFIEKYKKCIILLSGFEKLHLEEYAKLLSENFNFELIKFDYPDFELLNNQVSKSSTGLVIYGLTFPSDQIKFKANYHISLAGNRTLIDDDNKFNIYQENVKKNIVNKFKNIKDIEYHDDVYLDIFNLVIDMIEKKVYQERYEEVQKEKAKLSLKEKAKIEKKDTDTDTDANTDPAFETDIEEKKDKSEVIPKRDVVNEDSEYEKIYTSRTVYRGGNKIIGTRMLSTIMKF
jgi:uncharacterized FlgJ-related protein